MRTHLLLIVALGGGCRFDTSGLDLPPLPDGGGFESEAEAEAEAEGEPCGNGSCDPEEDCASCREDCCPNCGDGECGAGEDDHSCPADCGCQAGENTCACGVAPLGCFCGPGCLESGTCCPDAGVCGVDAERGTLTEGCGNLVCNADETCAICPTDCGLCAAESCPPLPVIVHYRTPEERAARGLALYAAFLVGEAWSKWQFVRSFGKKESTNEIAVAMAVPAGAQGVAVWAHYRQQNGRERASCEGSELDARPVGAYTVTMAGTELSATLVTMVVPGEPGSCSHYFAFMDLR